MMEESLRMNALGASSCGAMVCVGQGWTVKRRFDFKVDHGVTSRRVGGTEGFFAYTCAVQRFFADVPICGRQTGKKQKICCLIETG